MQNNTNKNSSGRKFASGCFAVVLFVVVVVFFRAAPAVREDVLFLVDDDAELLRFRPVPADAKTNFLLKMHKRYIFFISIDIKEIHTCHIHNVKMHL